MTAVLTIDIQDLNQQFVEDLKHQFAHSDVEIRVYERPSSAAILHWTIFGASLRNWIGQKNVTMTPLSSPLLRLCKSNNLTTSTVFQIYCRKNYGTWTRSNTPKFFKQILRGKAICRLMIFCTPVVQLLQMDMITTKRC